MGLFNKNESTVVQPTQRQMLENNVRNARHNILVVLGFSLLNIILLVTKSYTYFLFSAFVPYALADLGMALTGKYPAEYYGEDLSGLTFLDNSFLAIMLGIAGVMLIVYGLCWLFAKNKPTAWFVVALVLFSVDTLLMILIQGISLDMILDYVFHGMIIFSFARGISAVKKLKNLPEEPQVLTVDDYYVSDAEETAVEPVEE